MDEIYCRSRWISPEFPRCFPPLFHARDVGDEAVYMAGQVLSYSSVTSKFEIKWTDGTASTLTLSEVVEILLPPTPVSSVADSA